MAARSRSAAGPDNPDAADRGTHCPSAFAQCRMATFTSDIWKTQNTHGEGADVGEPPEPDLLDGGCANDSF